MFYNTNVVLLVLVLFIFLIFFTYLGLRRGRAKRQKKVEINEHSEIIVSLLALQGLLLAFTFSVASDRFEARRQAIVYEASSIRLAVRMADLYPAEERINFRRDLQGYLESRIDFFNAARNIELSAKALKTSDYYRNNLWMRITRLSSDMTYQIATEQMLTALKEMIEKSIIREGARRARVPDSIVLMLFIQSLATAFFIGYVNGNYQKPDMFLIVVFHLLVALVIYVTLDLDRPLQGLTHLQDIHDILVSNRELFEPQK